MHAMKAKGFPRLCMLQIWLLACRKTLESSIHCTFSQDSFSTNEETRMDFPHLWMDSLPTRELALKQACSLFNLTILLSGRLRSAVRSAFDLKVRTLSLWPMVTSRALVGSCDQDCYGRCFGRAARRFAQNA